MAASVDALSGGRFELGIGAGWNEGEHRMFGIDFPPYKTRLEMLDEGAQVIKALWSGKPATFAGKHYRLEGAEAYPLPAQSPPPLIMGGKGEKRTLRIVATHATEWNCSYSGIEIFRHKSRVLDEHCAAIGRDPMTLRRSMMIPFVLGRDDKAIQRNIDAHRRMFPSLPATLDDWLARGFPGGSPSQMVDQLKALEEAGAARFMLQHNDLDDLATLELLASEVLPHFPNT
ncbi:MAG: LLM class flavin-dependent oxidoreductase, partial [Chloroflexi bacterium]|nr:LLM class flavin-dependent oxidoreductase [Chloroflexota bacterium]